MTAVDGFLLAFTPGAVLARPADSLTVQVANQGFYVRCFPVASVRVSKIGYKVNTQSGNMCLAAYRNTGRGSAAAPDTRLATTGSFTTPATGYAEASLGSSFIFHPGDWLYIGADNLTAAFNTLLATGGDNDMGKGLQYRQASAFPAPATPGTLVATQGYNFALKAIA